MDYNTSDNSMHFEKLVGITLLVIKLEESKTIKMKRFICLLLDLH